MVCMVWLYRLAVGACKLGKSRSQQQEPGLIIGAHAYLRVGAGQCSYLWLLSYMWCVHGRASCVHVYSYRHQAATGLSMAIEARMSFGCMHSCCPGS